MPAPLRLRQCRSRPRWLCSAARLLASAYFTGAGGTLPERHPLIPKSSRHSAGDGGFSLGDSNIENISGFRAVERNLLIIGHDTIATSPATGPSKGGNTKPDRRSRW